MKISFRVEAKKYNKKRLIEIMSEVKPGLDIVDAKKISKNARGENNLAVQHFFKKIGVQMITSD